MEKQVSFSSPHESPPVARKSIRRILIADPEKETRDLLCRLLKGFGVVVVSCGDSSGIRQEIRRESFDLALVDAQLSDSADVTIVEALKNEDPEVDVVVMSAYATAGQAMAAVGQGACDVLIKPVQPVQVRSVAERAMARRALREELREVQAENMRLKELSQRLEFLNRLKDDFISTTSHELKTPLTVIGESLSILKDGILGPLGDRQQESISTMVRQYRRLRRLIQGVVDFTVVRSSLLDVSEVNLRLLLEEVLSELEPEIRAYSLQVETEIQEDAEKVQGDWVRLEQILFHLLSNAIKFSHREGRIKVALKRRAGEETIIVEDNGMGIPADQLNRIFDRFSSIDQGWTRALSGSGVGLALVRDYAELHNGSVSVRTVFGEGSVFTVTLPVTQGGN